MRIATDPAAAEALRNLKGLPLWSAGHAADVLWFEFGARRLAPTKRNPNREVGDLGLHIQCPWRISGPAGVVVGLADMAPSEEDVPPWESDSYDPARTHGAELLAAWVAAHAARPLVVHDAEMDRCGGFVLRLSERFALEVFPVASPDPRSAGEQWRLLRPGADVRHIVMTNSGVEAQSHEGESRQ